MELIGIYNKTTVVVMQRSQKSLVLGQSLSNKLVVKVKRYQAIPRSRYLYQLSIIKIFLSSSYSVNCFEFKENYTYIHTKENLCRSMKNIENFA